jgi:membrane-bound ClpP family serine protease
METFWTLLKESVILQAILTIGIWAAVIYLIVVGKEVPEVLTMAANLVLGFYFGSKLAFNRGS